MSLCTLCASIDLLAIPRLPKIYDGYTLPGAESVLISILKNPLARTSSATQSQSTAAPSAPDDEGNASLGTPYHPTLPSLQDSAQTCALCKIVLHDVERFQREFDGQDEERKGRSGKPDYSMVLARGARIGVDTSGFMVLCGDMERKKKLWVLGAVGIAVRDGDGLAGIVKGRVIEEIVLEEGSSGGIGLERMRQWMRECDEGCGNRGLKCGSGGERELPERMIRVGSKQDDVVEVEELGGKKGKYAVLSYVAEEEDIKRIRKDIEDMEESSRISMQWRRYPSVYQDAVVLTRELGLEFLWIDALWYIPSFQDKPSPETCCRKDANNTTA